MGIVKPSFLLLCIFLVSCGSRIPLTYGESKSNEPPTQTTQAGGGVLQGQFPLTNGGSVQLESTTRPTILIFVTYFCISCKEETKELAAFFRQRGGLPKNADLYTILVGGDIEQAKNWQKRFGVEWSMGSDSKTDLFLRYCSPEKLTPCSVTYTPGANTYQKHIGIAGPEVLEKETGPWAH